MRRLLPFHTAKKILLASAVGLLLHCAAPINARAQAPASNPARMVTAMDAQAAALRYARSIGLGTKGRIHGSLLPKATLVTLLQQDGCEGVRVFYGRNEDGERVAILWPVDAAFQNLTRKLVYVLPAEDLCPGNCDFQFMRDDYHTPRNPVQARMMDAKQCLRWIERYARGVVAAQTSSFLIQKGAVLQGLINNRMVFGIRAYHTIEPDLINASLYLVGADIEGHADWKGSAYYADNTNLCMGDCY